jgi:hypothetical protein
MVTNLDYSHLVAALLAVGALILSISPIRGIVDSENLTTGQKVYWVVVSLMFPIIGPIVWWVSAKRLR